jgi:hypothetical protein
MNIFPESLPEKYRGNKNYLLHQQASNCASPALHAPHAANPYGCISPEKHSQ